MARGDQRYWAVFVADAARAMAGVDPSYRSVSGADVTWTRRLVSVGEMLPTAGHPDAEGELFCRFFRNGAAYADLQWEDFEKTQDDEPPQIGG